MPKRLPIKDIISGLLKSIGRAVRYWFHYTLVAFAWLGVVPLTACKLIRNIDNWEFFFFCHSSAILISDNPMIDYNQSLDQIGFDFD